MTRFAVCRRLARFFARLDGVQAAESETTAGRQAAESETTAGRQAAESETTAGRQDKRPRANWRYGVDVVGVFARCTERYSAASAAYPLIFLYFRRAAHFRRGRAA